ncbi:MAG: hypothetical protein KBF42_00015 [Chitinophagales bacterium]|jgi:hypothetical protein|nr:hypothetical protein [Bacteroidota bacterium]MBK7567523.1 hypothetical protein [Bacteroidota bacterium]MBP8916845.1 hypothetical protein [Chitinophagales bacterium]MBP9219737.1 hypothetical protein [Chitinophagales bacterium]MBP9794793.1 hypothetical protein [Chitinophagales bacterium]
MKYRGIILTFLFLFLALASSELSAQCAMCKASAEAGNTDGNLQSATLNSGIMYLLVMPYLAFCVIGYLWYRNYKRRKKEEPSEA